MAELFVLAGGATGVPAGPRERGCFGRIAALLGLATLFPALACAGCIPFSEAGEHVGETKCIAGKVINVEQGDKGVHYLNFCEDRLACPFVAVIFAGDVKHIGDVRQLQGRSIEVHGDVEQYDGRAEIIVREPRQLRGDAARIPPLPKTYDVEQKGHYSAGTFRRAKPARVTTKKKQPATLPIQIPEDPE
jgi:hypothetical protein